MTTSHAPGAAPAGATGPAPTGATGPAPAAARPPVPRTRLRLQVDWTLCQARGHCLELLPEIIAEDPWGYPVSRSGAASARGFAVPDHLEPHARRAVSSCPRLALVLQEN